MTLPFSNELTRLDCHKALVDLLKDRLMAPRALAERWGYSDDHLANLRRAGYGLPWIRLPLGPKGTKGGVRYRLSDIISAEIDGYFGQVTLARVELAIAGCPALTETQRAAVQAHVRNALRDNRDPEATGSNPPRERRGRPRMRG
jgi:hypothetical protein